MGKKIRVLALTRYGRLGASTRLRTLQYIPWMDAEDICFTVQALFSDELLRSRYTSGGYGIKALSRAYAARLKNLNRRHEFDLMWIEKESLPWMPAWVERVLLSGVPYILDFDDAIFHNYDCHRFVLVRKLFGRRIDRLMSGAHLVIGGNQYLTQRARDAGAPWVEHLPTVVDLERYVQHSVTKNTAQPHIAWIGSPSTVRYLAALASPLQVLSKRHRFKLRVIGGALDIPGVDIECVPWTEATEVSLLQQCDIGIMPLATSPWELGKCGYKLIQYMASGLAVVASPVGVNMDIVNEGINGFFANDNAEWEVRLEQLLTNTTLRREMGIAGRKQVETKYSLQRAAPLLADLLDTAAQGVR